VFHSYVQQYLGFTLGRVPTSAPLITSTELVMYGTTMAVGSWLSTSFDMPKVTVGNQEFEITNWGEGVGRATMVVHDHADAVDTIGTSLDPPSAVHVIASQVVSVTRWDANGNKISFGVMEFRLCLGADYNGGAPEFHRYNDNSNLPNHLINEGGSVTDVGGNCYQVRTVKTSSVAGFRLTVSPSPSTAPSPSPSPGNATTGGNSDDGSDTALYGLFVLLVIPFACVLGVMFYMFKKAKGTKTESAQYMLGPMAFTQSPVPVAVSMHAPPPSPFPLAPTSTAVTPGHPPFAR
jgi:hypothetical protein